MLKFIHNDFELDLTHLNVNFNWKNIWFQREIESEWSFPFSMPKSVWSKIANLGSYNSVVGSNIYTGMLYDNGKIVKAQLKLQNKKGDIVSALIFVGYEGIPFLEKKLTDVVLMNFPVTDIKAHALTILPQGYPDVNYNFSSVHSDKYDKTTEQYAAFKCLNYFNAGAFIENTIEAGLDQIRNIMQPLPYLMYVLKTAIENDGYILQGDILNISDLKKTLIFRDGNYFKSTMLDLFPFHYPYTDWDAALPAENTLEKVSYLKELTVTKKGIYDLVGKLQLGLYRWVTLSPLVIGQRTSNSISIVVDRGGIIIPIYSVNRPATTPGVGETLYINKSLEVYTLELLALDLEVGDIIRLEVEEARRDIVPPIYSDYPEMSTLDLLAVRYKEADGTPIISIDDLDEINLAKCVPDITVSELIDSVRKAKNLGFDVEGNVVTMNFVKLDRTLATDCSKHDIEEPTEAYNDERSYELMFADGKSNEKHLYDSLFIDKTGTLLNNYTSNKNTTQISIGLLAYPQLNRDSINTAYAYEDEISKLRLVFYDHETSQDYPACYNNTLFDISVLYQTYYTEWIDFLLKAISYEWNFVIPVEQWREIFKSSIVYAYKNYHVFTEVEKEVINHMYYNIVAKSERLS